MPGVNRSLATVFSALGAVGRWKEGCECRAALQQRLGEVFGLDRAPSSRLELGTLLTCEVRACVVVWLGEQRARAQVTSSSA